MTGEPILLQANAAGQTEVSLVLGELSAGTTTEVYEAATGMLRTRTGSADGSFRPLGKRNQANFTLEPAGVAGVERLEVRFAVDGTVANYAVVHLSVLQLGGTGRAALRFGQEDSVRSIRFRNRPLISNSNYSR